MDFEEAWKKALKETEIIRARVQLLKSHSDTKVSYILLSESSINQGDTVVRRGEVLVQKPNLFVPPNNPQFHGFEFDSESNFKENALINFFLVRGVSIPSLHYDNRNNVLSVFEGKLSNAIKHYKLDLEQQENVSTGLLTAPEDYWQFSLLIFICSQIAKSADNDIRRLWDEFRKNNPPSA